MSETNFPQPPDLWATGLAPDPAPLLEQLAPAGAPCRSCGGCNASRAAWQARRRVLKWGELNAYENGSGAKGRRAGGCCSEDVGSTLIHSPPLSVPDQSMP